jgi:predicted ribosomally synthesized peptide with SipW-like signal peptide
MSIKLKIAWILSILATALTSFGLVGSGTSASFSDTASVTHQIQTGHVKLRIVKVDGQALDPAVDEYRLSDAVKGTKADITRLVKLRNDGTLDLTSLFLTTTPAAGDDVALAAALTVTVRLDDGTGATEASRTLADWETGPQALELPNALTPGESVTVTMHTQGKVDLQEDARVEPTYAFTAYAGE